MPDLKVRLMQKNEQGQDTIIAEGSHDQVKILQKGLLTGDQQYRGAF